ncbi:multidrug efflux pump subunit AcrA (membrane-fusion protein) [Pedobacter sp. UYP24]
MKYLIILFGNLIPGMYVTALISTGNQLIPSLPLEAVVRVEGKQYIFVVDDEKDIKTGIFRFVKKEVKTGISELGYVQVTPLDSLKKNAKVVTKGAFYLESKGAAGQEEE